MHGQRRYDCLDCSGGGVCEHGWQRYACLVCGGGGICKHGRQRYACLDCGGGSFFQICSCCSFPAILIAKQLVIQTGSWTCVCKVSEHNALCVCVLGPCFLCAMYYFL